MSLEKDILEQAKKVLLSESESIIQLIERLDSDFYNAVLEISKTQGRLIITGIGKSAHIANKIVATLNSTGTPSIFLHAAEAVHGDLGMITPQDTILCISKSGNSPEIKALVPLLKRDGNVLIAMTANETSFLAQNAHYVIDAFVEGEVCPNNLAPTNSTTVQLALGDAIAVCLMRLKNFTAENFAKYHPGGALGKKLLLKIEDVLDVNNKPSVVPETTIKETIIEISGKRLGATVVVDNQNIVGIITDGDIRRMLQANDDFKHLKACDVMTKNPKKIEKTALVSTALEIMENNSITQLPIVDNGNYCGIIHLHDILKEGVI